MPGITTLAAEVTNGSTHCFWLLLDDEELAMKFSDFPWFKSASIEQLSEIERPTETAIYIGQHLTLIFRWNQFESLNTFL